MGGDRIVGGARPDPSREGDAESVRSTRDSRTDRGGEEDLLGLRRGSPSLHPQKGGRSGRGPRHGALGRPSDLDLARPTHRGRHRRLGHRRPGGDRGGRCRRGPEGPGGDLVRGCPHLDRALRGVRVPHPIGPRPGPGEGVRGGRADDRPECSLRHCGGQAGRAPPRPAPPA